jgi:asparagine N-glycosylation enzyme membrane subunit Stt3
MKILISILIVLCTLTSCKNKTPEDRLRECMETNLIKDLHDPSSYEFVELTVLDTVYSIETTQKNYDNSLRNRGLVTNEDDIKAMDRVVKSNKKKLDETEPTEIESIRLMFTSRANNMMGAKIKKSYIYKITSYCYVLEREEM